MEDILRTREKYTEGEIIGIFTKLVEALKVAHSARIAHRDLTPKNLTLGDDLIDYIICGFGTGIILENSSINTIMTNEIIQKKHFLPPELAENHLKFKDFTYDVFKADIYSLGVCVLIMMGIKNEGT